MGDNSVERGSVLVYDADVLRAEELSHRLRFLNYEPVIAGTGAGSSRDDAGLAVVVGDLAGGQGLRRSFQQLTRRRPSLPLLVLPSSAPESEMADSASPRPVWHLDLPVRRAQLSHLLQRAERWQGWERRQRLIGNSKPVRAIRQMIEQVADYDINVLITGESGTGKELVAQKIHALSHRCEGPFVPINCGAIPADLLESELFGHEKGAFSGAISARVGRFELAEGGTLFLDEIGDMSLPMQVKLLRVLQERCYERVGSNHGRSCDVRIVAATHRDLPAAVSAGEFREDLYYRLNVFPIELPPLCKRRSDLPLLLDELLIRHQGDGTARLRVNPGALSALAAYDWPGNVRELSNLVERLAILKPGGEITLEDLPLKYRQRAADDTAVTPTAATPSADAATDLKAHLRQVEQDLIKSALRESGGVVAQAARLLRMRRTTLVEKLAKYSIA